MYVIMCISYVYMIHPCGANATTGMDASGALRLAGDSGVGGLALKRPWTVSDMLNYQRVYKYICIYIYTYICLCNVYNIHTYICIYIYMYVYIYMG